MTNKLIKKKLRQGLFSDTLLNMAADRIEELERQQLEWIDVNERLPEEPGWYLTFSPYENKQGGFIGTDSFRIKFDGMYFKNTFETFRKVTHWMPLPKPPENDCKE